MAQKRTDAGRGKTTRVVNSSKGSKKGFYILIAVAAIAGIAVLSYLSAQARVARVIALDPNLPPVTSAGYVMGSPSATIELTEFGDFECPGCNWYSTFVEPDVRTQYINTGKIRFRFIDYPLSMHKNTINASVAAACADEQGKFWEMHDQIFAIQDQWNTQATTDPDKVLKELGRKIPGMDGSKLDECIKSRRTLPRVQAHLKLALDRQANGTPTFVIGSNMYDLKALSDFKQVLDKELAAAEAARRNTKKP